MKELHLIFLDKQGYQVVEEEDFFILKRKLIKNRAKRVVFFPIALVFLFLTFGTIQIMDLFSVLTFLFISIVTFSIPFWDYLISPYYSIYVDKSLRTILFRARHSRAYRFSEITRMTLGVSSKYADVNAFSSSNKEYGYKVELYFGQSKEEVFKIVEKDESSQELIVELKEYFEKMLE